MAAKFEITKDKAGKLRTLLMPTWKITLGSCPRQA